MKAQDLIIHLLDTSHEMQLATTTGNQPWCVTVYFAEDNLHNLYWLSLPGSRHSTELAANALVAGNITTPRDYGQPVQGLSFSGRARLLTDKAEIQAHFQAYTERFHDHPPLENILGNNAGYQLYQLQPDYFVLFDEEHFPDQPRQEWQPKLSP